MLNRRAVIASLGAAALPPAWAAEPYLSRKPIKLVVPFAPGGGTDASARLIADGLHTRGLNVLVENRPGAGGRLGVESALREGSDGYTWIFVSSTFAASQAASPNAPKLSEVIPVVQTNREYSVLVASKKLGVATLSDLIKMGKAKERGMSVGTSGVGSLGHFCAAAFSLATGVKLRNIPYRGTGPAITDLVSGQTDIMFGPTTAFSSMVRGGMLQGIAVTSPKQIQSMPGVPTFEQAGLPSVLPDAIYGIVVAKGVDPQIVQTINQAVNQVIVQPATAEAFVRSETVPVGGSSDVFKMALEAEIERWSKVAKASHIEI